MSAEAESFYRWIGLFDLIFIWLTFTFVATKTHLNPTKPLADSLTTKKYYLFWAIIVSAASILFYVFASKWLVPTYHLKEAIKTLILAGILAEMLASWLPNVEGIKSILHNIFRYTAALIIPSVMVLLFTAASVSGWLKDIIIGLFILEVITGCILLTIKTAYKHYLLLQCLYILCFQLAIIAMIVHG